MEKGQEIHLERELGASHRQLRWPAKMAEK